MNERIKELAEQAREYANSSQPYEKIKNKAWIDVYDEKFAELIVEDVVTAINDLYHQTPLEKAVVLLDAIRLIENRFYGVKE